MKRCPAVVVCLVLTLQVLTASPARAQAVDEALRRDIEKLLEVTGSSKLAAQMSAMASGQVLDAMLKGTQVPPEAIELAKQVLSEEFTKLLEGPDGLNAEIVTVYAKHFTHDEVKGLIAFYETPLGRKTIEVMPQLVQESMVLGQGWAQKVTPRIVAVLNERLRAAGYIK